MCEGCEGQHVMVAIEALRVGKGHICPCCCRLLAHRSIFGGGVGASPHTPITPREREVMSCIARDQTTMQIAGTLFISEKTVRTHRSRLMEKLGVRTTAGLVVRAMQIGLLKLPQQGEAA